MCNMKIIITEGQTKNLITNMINEDNNHNDVLSFINLVNGFSSINGLDNTSSDIPASFSDKSELLHPLGKRFRISSHFGTKIRKYWFKKLTKGLILPSHLVLKYILHLMEK